jgi:segregation and condensation protein A
VLELFKEGVLTFDQATPLGDLHLRWTGTDAGDIDVGDEFDEPPSDTKEDAGRDEQRRPELAAVPDDKEADA